MKRLHACWLDKECREIGVGAFTYITFSENWVLRINPVRDNSPIARAFEDKAHWSWHVFQWIKRP